MKSLPSIYEVNLWFWFWSIYEAANLWSYFNRFLLSFLTPFDKLHIQNFDSIILVCALKVIKMRSFHLKFNILFILQNGLDFRSAPYKNDFVF